MTLPNWRVEGGAYICDDLKAMAFAQRVVFSACGFNVPEFDLWLSAMPPCDARDALMERREQAATARNMDALLRHLEYLHGNRVHIERTDFLRPRAQRDAKRQIGAGAGGKQAGKVLKKSAGERHAEWAGVARKLLKDGKNPRSVAGIIAKKYGVTPKTVNTALKKEGVK